MKFVDEYRESKVIRQIGHEIFRITSQPWTIMEVCGGQTHAIVKFGLDKLLPEQITLIHGPGCPVCVTPAEIIDDALAIAAMPGVIFCSFGDMLRVPGSSAALFSDLLTLKATGSDIRTIYSPLEALEIAQRNPERQVVFLAVGFETTAPATALAVYQAQQRQIDNFSMLVSHVLVAPAMAAILANPSCRVQGFLAAGHACTITGYVEYEAIAKTYQVPIVIAGFEPLDILQGIYLCIKQLEARRAEVENQYKRVVRQQGNAIAQGLVQEVFAITSLNWRGIGLIANSGLKMREKYAHFDAYNRLPLLVRRSSCAINGCDCISGLILQGLQKPPDCAAFGTHCTPEHPLGAPMVSSEGACAAYYRYR